MNEQIAIFGSNSGLHGKLGEIRHPEGTNRENYQLRHVAHSFHTVLVSSAVQGTLYSLAIPFFKIVQILSFLR